MQSGVAFEMSAGVSVETSPKHLRVGVNSAMVDAGAVATLLIAKGIFTHEEYVKAIADQMEIEAESYRKRISERAGRRVDLI